MQPQQIACSTRTHWMVTRTQDGMQRPRVFFSTRHPLPACFVAKLTTLKTKPKTYKQELKDPN